MAEEIRFRGVLEAARGGGHVVAVDPALADTIDARHRSRVRGTINGVAYRSNLVTMGGRLVLGVHKATVEASGTAPGAKVGVTMAADDEPLPNDIVPEILQRALDRSPAAKAAWERMPPSRRREHVGAIDEAKGQETRKRRVDRAIEQTLAWAEKRSGR